MPRKKSPAEQPRESMRRSEIIARWRNRPEHERASHLVLAFYQILERDHPWLLSDDRRGDYRYQELHTILKDHIYKKPGEL